MLEWLASGWLLAALASVPLVRWLHRASDPGAARPVSAIYLWSSAARPESPGGASRLVDPAWRRRALVALLLCAALAGPQWVGESAPPIEVWVDDSPSLLSREAGGRRADLARVALENALREVRPAAVHIRSLTRSGRALALGESRTLPVAWLTQGGDRLSLPAPLQMRPAAEHWLLTDGAAPELPAWVAVSPIVRIIQVGSGSENAAVTRLAARRAPRDSDRIAVLVEVVNRGRNTAGRELTLYAGAAPVARARLDIPPAGTVTHPFVLREREGMPWTTQPLRAALDPADALPDDDALILDLTGLAPVPVRIGTGCAISVRAAIMAHPALRVAAEEVRSEPGPKADPSAHGASRAHPNVPLDVACGANRPTPVRPTLLFRHGQAGPPLLHRPLWHPGARALRELVLEPGWLRAVGVADAPGDGAAQPLLSAGGQALILEHVGAQPLIEVRLALEASDLVRYPEFAGLFAGLVDRVLGRDLLGEVREASRPASAADIAPRALTVRAQRTAPVAARTGYSLSAFLLSAAALFLAFDLLRLLGVRVSRAAARTVHGS